MSNEHDLEYTAQWVQGEETCHALTLTLSVAPA